MSRPVKTVVQPNQPVLSILCLTYNHAAFIADALQSFLAQVTDFDFEIIVADDCSTDGTLEVVEKFRQRAGPRLRVLSSAVNLGVTRNFRRAHLACRGRFIAICEGDDFWRGTRKLQTQVDFLERHPDYVLTYHDATIVDDDGESDTRQLPPRLQCDASRSQLIATRPISTLTVCFRNVLGEVPREFDHAPALDLCLWSLLGQHGKGKYISDIEPAGYRVHSSGVFSTQTERNRQIMTAQSLLSLSRVYSRQDSERVGDLVLLKAVLFAAAPLGATAALRLALEIPALCFARYALRVWRKFSHR